MFTPSEMKTIEAACRRHLQYAHHDEARELNGILDQIIDTRDCYFVPLNQEEIATIAGFIQPTSSGIEIDAICGPFDTLREKLPERAFWETVEELGESFYWNAEEED